MTALTAAATAGLRLTGAGLKRELKTSGGGRVFVEIVLPEVEINAGEGSAMPEERLMEWIGRAVEAVSGYYGRFPVADARVEIRVVEGRASVFNAVTFGNSPQTMTRISVGQRTTEQGLREDWVATHELVHLAFPSVPRRHHWIEEGLATYIEPLARLHAGQISENIFWRDMIRDMPQGLPKEGDEGLDRTHTWGRTYWGGAIYCLECEVGIRVKTGGRAGLQQALRGILEKAGSIQVEAELADVLRAGDAATGTTVLLDTYGRMKEQAAPVDLASMWRELGVAWKSGDGDRVQYDDRAKLAGVRKAIVTPSPATRGNSPTRRG